MSEVTPTPAIGASVTVNLDGHRQIVLQGFFAADTPPSEANAFLDKMMALSDRQQARYQLPEVEEELRKHKRAVAQYEQDRAELDTRHVHEQARRRVEIDEMVRVRKEMRDKRTAELNVEILEIQDARKTIYATALEAHQRGGRQGSFVPRGHDKTNIDRLDSAIEKAKENREAQLDQWDREYDACIHMAEQEFDKAAAEKDFADKNFATSITRFTVEVNLLEEKLATLRARAEG